VYRLTCLGTVVVQNAVDIIDETLEHLRRGALFGAISLMTSGRRAPTKPALGRRDYDAFLTMMRS